MVADLSVCKMDLDTLMFIKSEPKDQPWFSINISFVDTIHVVDAPPEILALIKSTLESAGQFKKSTEKRPGETKIELSGNPWAGRNSADIAKTAHLTSTLFANLLKSGWRPYASIDMSTHERDKDTWFFTHIES